MHDQVELFYNSLAEAYHLIFEDWDRAIARQAQTIDRLIRNKLGAGPLKIHDCACGIGTQAIGLAALGHRVSGSDLSEGAVQRAVLEASRRDLNIDCLVSDMTDLAQYASEQFDVLIALDNALPHLSADQLRAAAHSFKRVLHPGGLFVGSTRDYDDLIKTRPAFQGPSFFGSPGQRRIVHQVWDWTGRDCYDVHQYISLERDSTWETLHFSSPYRCLLRAEVEEALRSAGFVDIEWLMPVTSGYYQPVVTALAPRLINPAKDSLLRVP